MGARNARQRINWHLFDSSVHPSLGTPAKRLADDGLFLDTFQYGRAEDFIGFLQEQVGSGTG